MLLLLAFVLVLRQINMFNVQEWKKVDAKALNLDAEQRFNIVNDLVGKRIWVQWFEGGQGYMCRVTEAHRTHKGVAMVVWLNADGTPVENQVKSEQMIHIASLAVKKCFPIRLLEEPAPAAPPAPVAPVAPAPVPAAPPAPVFAVGDTVQAQSLKDNQWYPAKIVKVFEDGKVKVHFINWGKRYDEKLAASRVQA